MTTRSPHTCLLKEEPEVELKSRSHLRAFLQHRLYFSFNHLSLALLLSWISIPFSSQFLQEWSLRIPPQGSMRVPMEMQIPGSCSRTVISIFLILEKLNIFNLRLRRFLIKCSSFFFFIIILDLQRSCKVMAVSFHEHFIQLLLALSSSLTTQ